MCEPLRRMLSAAEERHPLVQFARRYELVFRIGCVWGAVLIMAVLLRGAFQGGGRGADFALFYETIERARLGLPLYGPILDGARQWLPGPNYNPPHFYVAVAPFAAWPFPVAFVSWTLAGLIAGLYLAKRTVQTVGISVVESGALLSGCLVACNASLGSTLRTGQLSLLLAVPVTLAWIAYREGRLARAGWWIGLAASVKPFLLVVGAYFLVSRRWGAAVAMTLAGLGAATVGVVVFGTENFLTWLAVFQEPRMDQHFHNASFSSFAARSGIASGYLVWVVVVTGVAATILFAVTAADPDLRWLILMSGALLWSPLGWIYYGFFLMPPLVALAVKRTLPALSWAWVVLWLWPPYTPGLASASPVIATTIGSVYFWGLFLLWVGALANLTRSGRGRG